MDAEQDPEAALSARSERVVRDFHRALDEIQWEHCTACREKGFNLKVVNGECKRCRDVEIGKRLWTDANKTNPLPADQYPECLKGLTPVEEMLISAVKVHMQVRYTSGGQRQYRDHIVNFHQNITEVATTLPRLPEDIDMVIIRAHGVDLSHHVDFLVRREPVKRALEYKIANDPAYAGYALPSDEELAQMLPEYANVADRLTVLEANPENSAPGGLQPGPAQAAGEEAVDIEEAIHQGVLNLGATQTDEVAEVRRQTDDILNTNGRAAPRYV
ncbi:hypothetical protein BD626DRAFT_390550 [Schizophyllum amplum]|uniref:DUF6570 domain-containing protein n=1 Tax=Schizophyllum amplum TaxID=97359 RepID=A0A550CW84_9AGAR|nr:hypothetical protein BD626DRAFT_390550 [Auriculariopsis ampla]